MAESCLEVLLGAGRAMKQSELAVALKEAGFPTTMTARNLSCCLGTIMTRDRRFRKQGKKWVRRAD